MDGYTPLLLDLPYGSLDGLTDEEIEEVQTLAAAAALHAARDIRKTRAAATESSNVADVRGWGLLR